MINPYQRTTACCCSLIWLFFCEHPTSRKDAAQIGVSRGGGDGGWVKCTQELLGDFGGERNYECFVVLRNLQMKRTGSIITNPIGCETKLRTSCHAARPSERWQEHLFGSARCHNIGDVLWRSYRKTAGQSRRQWRWQASNTNRIGNLSARV